MAMKFRARKNINIGRVVYKIVATLIALWAGGTIITELGSVMNGTSSPFYKGLSLIGWTVEDAHACPTATLDNCITATSGSGILAVVGIIGIASVVMEFVSIKF